MIRAFGASLFLIGLIVFNFIDLNKRKISASEFLFWQFGALTLIIFLIFPDLGQSISEKVGFELLANLIFSLIILALLIIVILQSRLIHNLKSQIQNIVEKIALDEKEIN